MENENNNNDIISSQPPDDVAKERDDEKNVRLPHFAAVVDEKKRRIGKVRKSVWSDLDGNEVGTFVKHDKDVFLMKDDEKKAYLDNNGNVLGQNGLYMATLRRPWGLLLLILLILLALITAVSIALASYFLTRSGGADYAPVIFIATEEGESWEDSENLPVFYNESFGGEKIVPGMSGSYRFIFENRNDDTLEYSLEFTEQNEYGIGLVYKLKRDGAYISGRDEYTDCDGLGIEKLSIEANSSTVFELEWYWKDNDQVDTVAGEQSAIYVLTISLSAYVEGSR